MMFILIMKGNTQINRFLTDPSEPLGLIFDISLYMLALWRLSRRVDHSSFILSCNLTGQRENKSRYVTEIVLPLGYADVIFRRREAKAGNTSAFAGYPFPY